MTYKLCLKMLGNPMFSKEELKSKFDVLYLMNRLTEEEYKELMSKLEPPKVEHTEEQSEQTI